MRNPSQRANVATTHTRLLAQNVRELGMSVVGIVQLAAGILCLAFMAVVYVAHGICIVVERARGTVLQAV